ncbi:MAG: DsbC family protein [Pseudomonadota bacterium]
MKRFSVVVCAAVMAASSGTLFAADALNNEQLKQKLDKLLPTITVTAVNDIGVAGIREVDINGEILYISEDGKHLFQGDIYNIEKEMVNLTENRRNASRKELLDAVEEKEMISFGDKDAKHRVIVFTDIDCPYCAKLHNEMDQYNAEGIRISYLFFPRAGVKSPSGDKAVSVWCADDQQQAMTTAKAGGDLEKKTCDNPVQEHLELGQKVGVTGTPAIIAEDGQLLPGYIPAKRLSKYLEQ